jgi:hypothetical protein
MDVLFFIGGGMIKVGDKVMWDSQAHTHTKFLASVGCKSTGVVYGILPKGFKHVDDHVEQCKDEGAVIIWVKVDDDTARIGLSPEDPDVKFPDAEADDEVSDGVAALVADLMG